MALEHLASLASTTANSLAVGNISDIVAIYKNTGWRADDAVVRALACVSREIDSEAVGSAIRTVYLPWLEDSARHVQQLVRASGYPGGHAALPKQSRSKIGECFVFVDGLRFDTGKRLSNLLSNIGFSVEEMSEWAALPSVTATGKPAVTPVRRLIRGEEANADFEPSVIETGHFLKGGQLQKLLVDSGVKILGKAEAGDGKGRAWCEVGDIDSEGHDHGSKLARYLESKLSGIVDRVEQLLDAGWKTIRIVTDHGWLIVPGGLSKIDLPVALIETKWGRCAAIKPGAITEEHLYPWYWNPNQNFALADGASCYRNGLEYTHGGLSLQECLTLALTVSRIGKGQDARTVEITDIKWKQQRCTVALAGDFSGLALDIRTQPGDPGSSIVMGQKPFKESGLSSVVVENEELRESQATIVLIDEKGELVAQSDTTIGGDND